jgi:hypothetical protein
MTNADILHFIFFMGDYPASGYYLKTNVFINPDDGTNTSPETLVFK